MSEFQLSGNVADLDRSSAGQMRAITWFNLTHGLGLAIFLAAMVGFFWYLQIIENRHHQQGLYRDIEWAQQTMRLKWREDQDRLMAVALEWGQHLDRPTDQSVNIREFLNRSPEIAYLAVLDEHRMLKWVQPSRRIGSVFARSPGSTIDDSAGFAAFTAARDEHRSIFSPPFLSDDNDVVVELHAPVVRDGRFQGTVIAATSLQSVLAYSLPREVRERYQVMIVDQGGNPLVSSTPRHVHDANVSYELPLDPPGYGLRLRAYAFTSNARVIDRTLLAAIFGLGSASLISLALLWRHARKRLAAETERDRLFTLSVDPMAIMQRDGKFMRVNPAFGELFRAPGALSDLVSLTHTDDRPQVAALLEQLAGSEHRDRAVQFEARFLAGSQTRWLRWSIRSVGARSGQHQTLYAVAHDTTESKHAQAALHAETAFRRAMEDSVATGMRALDMQGRITYVNRAFCQMLGFEEAELLNRLPPFPYWPDQDQPAHQANIELILQGQAPAAGLHAKLRRKDGSLIDARLYVSALRDQAGAQTGWMTSITDITEPNRVREQLAAAQERFTTVLDELDAAVSVAAIEEPVPIESPAQVQGPAQVQSPALLFANRFYRGIFGQDPSGHRELARAPGSIDSRAAQNPTPVELYLGSVGRWFEVRTRPIRWVDGRTVEITVAIDITRRREAEQWQRTQAEKFEGHSRLISMGEMASSLAHELNQPLTAIANYCTGLSARVRVRHASGQSVDADELLNALGKTSAQAERAGRVIRRIRDFVKRSEPEHRDCEISVIVADAVGLAEIESSRQNVRLVVDVAANLPVVRADPVLLEQVLLNLLKNAMDAMRDQPVRKLALSVNQRVDTIEFSVSDTGPGIARDLQEKLFEPFFTTKPDGMGMGLNICRSIIEAHNGRLWVINNPQAGCTFSFSIPVGQPQNLARAA